jgi:hypothetical protein
MAAHQRQAGEERPHQRRLRAAGGTVHCPPQPLGIDRPLADHRDGLRPEEFETPNSNHGLSSYSVGLQSDFGRRLFTLDSNVSWQV